MKKPRILIGITYWLPNISGVTQYGVILADELSKRKYKVKIITSKFNKKLKSNEDNIVRVDGFQIDKGFVMPMYWWKSLTMVRNIDVINCHLPSVESFWLALWGKLWGKKIVVTHHCEFNFTGSFSNKLISIITYPIHWCVYKWADKIVAYTKDYADTSVFLKFFKSKLVYILPPIKITPFQSTPSPSFNKEGKKIVGFVGRIAWEKGLDVLIKAMKNVEAELILVGPYRDVAGDKTYKKLNKVKLIGPIEHNKLNKYYEMFDCLVLPSTNNLETFGIVQAEAMLCGCPVVASNLPGVRVPVRLTGMGEICEVGNIKDLQEKINIVLKNGKKYYQQKAKNLGLFDYRKTVDEYEKLW